MSSILGNADERPMCRAAHNARPAVAVPKRSTDGSRYTLRTAAAIASHASRSTRRDEATFMRMRPSPPAP